MLEQCRDCKTTHNTLVTTLQQLKSTPQSATAQQSPDNHVTCDSLYTSTFIFILLFHFRVSGLSPFMGDNDNETLSNVTSATWDFEDEAFDEISDEAKDFISNLLKKDMK